MACDQVIDSYEDYDRTMLGPTLAGQAFTMGGVKKTCCAAKFVIYTDDSCGTPNVNFTAKLFACTGTPGTDGEATGEALATSNTINKGVMTGPTEQLFTFGTPYELQANTDYCIAIEIEKVAETGGIGQDSISPTHSGNHFDNNGPDNAEDAVFWIYAESGWGAKINDITPGKVNGVAVADIGKINGV